MVKLGRPKKSKDRECTCKQCGKLYLIPGWQKYGMQYCSPECYATGRIGKPGKKKIPEARICTVCGSTFYVGCGIKNKTVTMCSRRCSGEAHFINGKEAATMEPTVAAYLAGFMDGEGTVSLYCRGRSLKVKISAVNTKREVIDWVVKRTAVGAVGTSKSYSSLHSIKYCWQANSLAAVSVLKQLLPYLVLKRRQAEIAIDAQQKLSNPLFKRDIGWQQQYLNEMHRLNKRGPAAA